MSYLVELAIICKPATLNPEDKVIGDALKHLGYNHEGVKKGRYLSYTSNQPTEQAVREEASGLFKDVLTKIGLASFNTETFRVLSISPLEKTASEVK